MTIKSGQTYMNLTDVFSNKRLLSIFKHCCEKRARERCHRPNSDVLARHVNGSGPLKLARMMGGDVTVTSEPGKGSAFTMRLPGR